MPASRPPGVSPWTAALVLVGGLLIVRLITIFATPLELYPDEAQYWLWSRELAWGYYSKPPMVAWWIAATTALGGDGEPWVRLSSPLAHAVAALALFAAGRTLYTPWTGFWAAALYSLMPGVQLSAGLITTDAPMLLFLCLAAWAYAVQLTAADRRTSGVAAAALGAALGLAILSKYAGLYFAVGLVLHALLDGRARRAWSGRALAAAAAGALLILAPNLLWNLGHGFATVAHTADNAQWSGRLFNPGSAAEFLTEQLGVFGPAPFLVLLGGVVLTAARPSIRRASPLGDRALLCLALTPLLVVLVQAFISRANANWAAAAYAPGSVLVAAWLVRHGRPWARWTLGGAALTQAALIALFVTAALSTTAASALGLDNGLKRARGWSATSAAITARAGAEPWTAVTVDDRFLFNALAYYGRDFWARPNAPPLRMWVREVQPQNQAETEAPLRPAEAGRVLHASLTPEYAPEAARDFRQWRALGTVRVRLDRERARDTQLFEARGWSRAPRDPATGRPYDRPTAP